MSIAEPAAARSARNLDAGMLLVAIGAVLLLLSLFLAWYEPGIEGWDAFEVWDLVLAGLAIAALVAVAARMGFGPPRPDSWLLAPGAVTFLVVVASLLDHPPAADGPGNDPTTGIWVAFVAALLMTAGAVLAVARISVAVNVGDPAVAPVSRWRFGRGAGTAFDPGAPAPSPPIAGEEPAAAPEPPAPAEQAAPAEPTAAAQAPAEQKQTAPGL
jgi:hypothetical protein